jgi:hypothetical protein
MVAFEYFSMLPEKSFFKADSIFPIFYSIFCFFICI